MWTDAQVMERERSGTADVFEVRSCKNNKDKLAWVPSYFLPSFECHANLSEAGNVHYIKRSS